MVWQNLLQNCAVDGEANATIPFPTINYFFGMGLEKKAWSNFPYTTGHRTLKGCAMTPKYEIAAMDIV